MAAATHYESVSQALAEIPVAVLPCTVLSLPAGE